MPSIPRRIRTIRWSSNSLSINIGRINATLSRDTRDDILNATRGKLFFKQFLKTAPPKFGAPHIHQETTPSIIGFSL